MRHVEKALEEMKKNDNKFTSYIEITNKDNIQGVPPVVHFMIQSDPISEVGINGCQARDMLEYLIHLFKSFNSAVPSRETSITITKLQEALMWQDERTRDRTLRNVEGTNEK